MYNLSRLPCQTQETTQLQPSRSNAKGHHKVSERNRISLAAVMLGVPSSNDGLGSSVQSVTTPHRRRNAVCMSHTGCIVLVSAHPGYRLRVGSVAVFLLPLERFYCPGSGSGSGWNSSSSVDVEREAEKSIAVYTAESQLTAV